MQQELEPICQIYEEYYAALAAARAAAKPTDGLLGFGPSLGNDPCQARFAEQLEQALNALAAEKPANGTACAVLRYLCEEPPRHTGDEVCHWMLLAVHRFGATLVPYLTREQAAELADFYEKTYPRSGRLPVQNTFYAALRQQSGEAGRKKHTFFWKI
ncbi:MAG: hypothetical protein LKJ90_06050 [Faecalibacterium sp.]|jgi:hypothetical protein|nr:hypothetical protein [Faecalibacterium sp.]